MNIVRRSRVIYHHVHPSNFGSICDLACAYVRDIFSDDLDFRVSLTLVHDWIQRSNRKNDRRIPTLFEFSASSESWVVRFRLPIEGRIVDGSAIEFELKSSLTSEAAYLKNLVIHVDSESKSLEIFLASAELTETLRTSFVEESERVEMGDLDYRRLLEIDAEASAQAIDQDVVYRVENTVEDLSQEVQVVRGRGFSGFRSKLRKLFSKKKEEQDAIRLEKNQQTEAEARFIEPAGNEPQPNGTQLSLRSNDIREKEFVIHELREKLKETARQADHLRIKLRDQNVKEQNWVARLTQAENSILSEKAEKSRLLAVIKDLREQVAKVSRSIEQHRPHELGEMRARLDQSIREESRLRHELARRELVDEQKQTLLKRIEELQLQLAQRSQARDSKSGGVSSREQLEFYQRQVGELKRMNQNLLERVAQLEATVKQREAEPNEADSEKIRLKLEEALKMVVKHRKEADQLRLRIDEMVRENEVLKSELQHATSGGKVA